MNEVLFYPLQSAFALVFTHRNGNWDSVTAAKCCKCTSHLRKVIPTVVQREGKVSGFFLNEQTAPLGATNFTSLGLPC